jgi:hypothetical protein
MQLPSILQGDSLTRLMQGAAAGAAVTMIIGFGWGGWTLGSKAESMADDRATVAVVKALAPICVDRFKSATNAPATWVALKAVDSWNRDSFVAKGGWATFPGNAAPNLSVAEACAKMLSGAK